MRFSDDLAARRRLYAMPLITAPAVMVIDVPRHLAGQGLALDRYYIVMIENPEELAEFEDFLAADHAALQPPDLLDRRSSNRETAAISFFAYAPPDLGWPWLLICHWPRDLADMVGADPDAFARGAYTMEAFADRAELQAALQAHIAYFGESARVQTIPPISRIAGHA